LIIIISRVFKNTKPILAKWMISVKLFFRVIHRPKMTKKAPEKCPGLLFKIIFEKKC